MGYMHIQPLYKCPKFHQLFKEIFVMEKIHGTSTWIQFKSDMHTIQFHSGGEKGAHFEALFDRKKITEKFEEICSQKNWTTVRIHGEAYGGKQQKMSATYGPHLKFIVFEVCVDVTFLDVPDVEKIATDFGLEFVHYDRCENSPELIEHYSNLESVQAVRNGMGHGKPREGVVIRPIKESIMPDGKRAIFKHKNAEFWEIKTRRPLGEKLLVSSKTDEIVEDWVTPNRFEHVKDRVLQQKEDKSFVKTDIKLFLELMVEDVQRESEGEVVWSEDLVKKIRQKTAFMFKSQNSSLNMK